MPLLRSMQPFKQSTTMMMIVPAAVLLIAALTGCGSLATGVNKGSGNVKTENRPISGVTAVTLDTSGELTIIQGETESLTIESDDNILPMLTSDVNGGTLELGTKPNSSLNTTVFKYTLTVPALVQITVNGSGDVNAETLNGDNLTVSVNGSGDVTLASVTLTGQQTINVNGSGAVTINALNAPSLGVVDTGAGDVMLSGTVPQIEVELGGSGALNASGMDTETAKITIDGSGDANLQVSQELEAHINGSGSVNYIGSPQVKGTRTGSGSANMVG